MSGVGDSSGEVAARAFRATRRGSSTGEPPPARRQHRGPSGPMATVCSKWAARAPSRVEIVRRRRAGRWAGLPATMIGSMASTRPSTSRGPRPAGPWFGHDRVLPQLAPDPVPAERGDDREALGLDPPLHGRADVSDVVSGTAGAEPVDQGEPAGLEQVDVVLVNGADRHGDRGVGDPAVERDPGVEGDHVALVQGVAVRDPVHHHGVRGGADRLGEPWWPRNVGAPPALRMASSARASSSPVVTPGLAASRSSARVSATTAPARAMASMSSLLRVVTAGSVTASDEAPNPPGSGQPPVMASASCGSRRTGASRAGRVERRNPPRRARRSARQERLPAREVLGPVEVAVRHHRHPADGREALPAVEQLGPVDHPRGPAGLGGEALGGPDGAALLPERVGVRGDQRRTGRPGLAQRLVQAVLHPDEAVQPDRHGVGCTARVVVVVGELEARQDEQAVALAGPLGLGRDRLEVGRRGCRRGRGRGRPRSRGR